MITFFLRWGFVNDVLYVLGDCFDKASAGKLIFRGFAPNTREPFTSCLGHWLQGEMSKLDEQEYGSPVAIGDAIHRCRVWIGVHLALEAYNFGATDVPKHIVKKFWKPANEVTDLYFANLRARKPAPFSTALREGLNEALENAS